MLIHPTAERLRGLGLSAMADALLELQNNPQAAELPHADWLGLLVDREASVRDNRRLARRLQIAKLRQAAAVRIPTEAGHPFRREAGQRSDLMSATIPR